MVEHQLAPWRSVERLLGQGWLGCRDLSRGNNPAQDFERRGLLDKDQVLGTSAAFLKTTDIICPFARIGFIWILWWHDIVHALTWSRASQGTSQKLSASLKLQHLLLFTGNSREGYACIVQATLLKQALGLWFVFIVFLFCFFESHSVESS